MRQVPPVAPRPGLSFSKAPLTLLATLLLCLVAATAGAQTWAELGDAGSLPGSAQSTAGTGALTKITGSLPTTADVDMYCIRIVDRTNWSACLLCAVHADADIWLFDGTGKGLAAAQLCQGGCKQLTNTFVPSNGLYYLAVSPHGAIPLAGANGIWLAGTTLERAPDGPGAAGTITAWGGAPVTGSLPTYTVNLFSGSSFCNAVTALKKGSWGHVKKIYR